MKLFQSAEVQVLVVCLQMTRRVKGELRARAKVVLCCGELWRLVCLQGAEVRAGEIDTRDQINIASINVGQWTTRGK
jgi:hypothetical protein